MTRGRDWLDHHLETFVRPRLGYIPNIEPYIKNDYNVRQLTPVNVTVMVEAWHIFSETAKRLSKPILLAGRDVYLFAVIAGMEETEVTFRPDISSTSVKVIAAKEPELRKYCLLDTGSRGSVPKALGITDFWLLYYGGKYNGHTFDKEDYAQHQLFHTDLEKLAVCRDYLYGCLENIHKYWTRAELDPETKSMVMQGLADDLTFANAARITQYVAGLVGSPT